MTGVLKREEGFTLVELLTVVALVGIAAAIAFPTLQSQIPKMRLKSAVREVAHQMQLARLKAISTNKEHRIKFVNNAYPTADSYRIERLESGDWATGTVTQVRSEVTLSRDANIDAITCSNSDCEFNTNGSAESGSICLKLKDTTERRYRIGIAAAIGKITIYEGEGC